MGEEVNGCFCGSSLPFIFKGMLSVIGINELRSMNLISWFPGVICFWVPYPLDEVLESSSPSGASMINDSFDLVFFFSFDKVRRWPRVVGPVCVRFVIGR